MPAIGAYVYRETGVLREIAGQQPCTQSVTLYAYRKKATFSYQGRGDLMAIAGQQPCTQL